MITKLSDSKMEKVTTEVHGIHGDSFRYNHTVLSTISGHSDIIHSYDNYSRCETDVPWDDRRTVMVLNGKVLSAL